MVYILISNMFFHRFFMFPTCVALLQNMLCNPVLEYAVNVEAASMIRNSPEAYVRIAKECVQYSQHLEGLYCMVYYTAPPLTGARGTLLMEFTLFLNGI